MIGIFSTYGPFSDNFILNFGLLGRSTPLTHHPSPLSNPKPSSSTSRNHHAKQWTKKKERESESQEGESCARNEATRRVKGGNDEQETRRVKGKGEGEGRGGEVLLKHTETYRPGVHTLILF
jgi:hypothetical protein